MLSQVGILWFLMCTIFNLHSSCLSLLMPMHAWDECKIEGPRERTLQDCNRCSSSQLARREATANLQYSYIANQMMPRLPSCLFKCIQKQPPSEVFYCQFELEQQYWCTEKVLLAISHKIHKENTCARVSFLKFIKKRLWNSCFPVNCAKFLRTPLSQNTSCSLAGDCCFFLLIFLSPPSFHLFVASYRYLLLRSFISYS